METTRGGIGGSQHELPSRLDHGGGTRYRTPPTSPEWGSALPTGSARSRGAAPEGQAAHTTGGTVGGARYLSCGAAFPLLHPGSTRLSPGGR